MLYHHHSSLLLIEQSPSALLLLENGGDGAPQQRVFYTDQFGVNHSQPAREPFAGVRLYNDNTTTFLRPPPGEEWRRRVVNLGGKPWASSPPSCVYVYDPYARTMWLVGAKSRQLFYAGRDLDFETYRAIWCEAQRSSSQRLGEE